MISQKRMGMIKGARRSAKQVVDKYVQAAIMKIEVCGSGTAQVYEQLKIYRGIANDLGWTDIATKIDNCLRGGPNKGIFTEP